MNALSSSLPPCSSAIAVCAWRNSAKTCGKSAIRTTRATRSGFVGSHGRSPRFRPDTIASIWRRFLPLASASHSTSVSAVAIRVSSRTAEYGQLTRDDMCARVLLSCNTNRRYIRARRSPEYMALCLVRYSATRSPDACTEVGTVPHVGHVTSGIRTIVAQFAGLLSTTSTRHTGVNRDRIRQPSSRAATRQLRRMGIRWGV